MPFSHTLQERTSRQGRRAGRLDDGSAARRPHPSATKAIRKAN